MLPKRFPDREEVAVVREEAERLEAGQESDEKRRLAGRVMARRGHGQLTFFDLVDRSGRMQLVVEEGRAGSVDVDLGDIVGVFGSPMRSRRGEPSLAVDELELLAKNRRPLPDTFHGLQDTEARYRRRYLDLLMNEETRSDALLRSRVIAEIRRWLDGEGFVEVETPILQPRYGGAFAEPFVTHYNALDQDYYLRIADELYLKRLIVGGLEKVYEIGKDFRNEGLSYKHQPEFTQLEWYEAYADYRDTMERMENLVDHVANAVLGTTKVTYRGHDVDVSKPWERVKLVDALEEHQLWTRDPDELRSRLEARDVDTKNDRDWAQLVDHALTSFVEPALTRPTILHDYPVELSPFAKRHPDDPRLVERFEAFAGGMEIANAFTELNDPLDQLARFVDQQRDREAGDEEAMPIDADYINALMYGMPPTGGIGIGIDRLTMVLTDQSTIRDVILFPAMRALPAPDSTTTAEGSA